jgi:hypothetical protein
VKHFEMHSYSWSLVLGQLSQVSWSGRWTWVWVMLPAAELQGPAVKTRKEKLPSLSYIILYLWSLDWNGFCTCISDEFGWFKSFLHVFTLRCFTLFLQLIWFRWVRGPFFLMEHNGAMLLMRSEQPGDLGCSQNALARCPQSISILYYII